MGVKQPAENQQRGSALSSEEAWKAYFSGARPFFQTSLEHLQLALLFSSGPVRRHGLVLDQILSDVFWS